MPTLCSSNQQLLKTLPCFYKKCPSLDTLILLKGEKVRRKAGLASAAHYGLMEIGLAPSCYFWRASVSRGNLMTQ